MKIRILSFFTACILLIGCNIPVAAADATDFNCIVVAESDSDNIISPRGFTRNYKSYIDNSGSVEIMSDPNWDIWNDTSVTVKFKSTQGPEELLVFVYYRAKNGDVWNIIEIDYLQPGDVISCNIPQNYQFRVTASLIEGEPGNVTFQVSLS